MGIPKVAAEASTLTVGGVGKGEARTSISVPAGTYVVLDVNGLHRNRMHLLHFILFSAYFA